MCHSATARPTHEVVVGRAVFVTWNPPTTARSRTRTGFVFCFFPFAVLHQPNRRGHRDIRLMCHSSSDVLARPRRPPPESSVESSAPESAKLFCEWQSRVRSRPPESSAKSRRRPRQGRPDVPAKVVRSFFGVPAVPTRVVQQAPPGSSGLCQSHPTSSPGSPALSESSAVIRRPCQSRPLSVPESGQECRSSSRPRSFARYLCTECPPSFSRMSRPRQTTVVRRPRHGRSPPHRL